MKVVLKPIYSMKYAIEPFWFAPLQLDQYVATNSPTYLLYSDGQVLNNIMYDTSNINNFDKHIKVEDAKTEGNMEIKRKAFVYDDIMSSSQGPSIAGRNDILTGNIWKGMLNADWFNFVSPTKAKWK